MSCRNLPLYKYLQRRAPAALLCLGLGAVGCAGGHFNLSSRLSRGEEIAADAEHETEQQASTQKEASSIARLLRLPRNTSGESETHDEPRNGRVFSALVDRRPQSADSASDPFLARETAVEPAPDSLDSASGSAATQQRAAVQNTGPQRPSLSDDQLWKMLGNEGSAAAVPAPSHLAAETPSRAADTPVWAQPPRAPAQSPTDQDDYQTPAFAATPADETPEHATHPSTTAPATVESTDDEHRLQVEALLSEARRHEVRGALQEAYHAAALAERIAGREHLVFAPQDDQPADIARRLVQKMQTAPKDDPFGEIAIKPITGPAASVDQESAEPQFPGADEQQSELPTIAENIALTPSVQTPREPALGLEVAFPPAQEWRGVKANTPVSLAVVESGPAPFQRSPDPVEYAVLKAPGAESTGTLPRRLEAGNEPSWSGHADQRVSWPGTQFGGPALQREPEPATPSSVAPPPPLDVGAERRLSPGPREKEATAADPRTGGMTWWLLGAVTMLAAAVLVKVRRRRTGAL